MTVAFVVFAMRDNKTKPIAIFENEQQACDLVESLRTDPAAVKRILGGGPEFQVCPCPVIPFVADATVDDDVSAVIRRAISLDGSLSMEDE